MACAACATGSVNVLDLHFASQKAVHYAILARQLDGACSRREITKTTP
jgi:hypothetical protein